MGWRGVSEWTSIYVLQDFVVRQTSGLRDSCYLVVFWQYIMETGSPGLRRLLCDYFGQPFAKLSFVVYTSHQKTRLFSLLSDWLSLLSAHGRP